VARNLKGEGKEKIYDWTDLLNILERWNGLFLSDTFSNQETVGTHPK